jgi:hypothetical protein
VAGGVQTATRSELIAGAVRRCPDRVGFREVDVTLT